MAFRGPDDGGAFRRQHLRIGQQTQIYDQLQPQGLLLRRQHGRIRNPQPARDLLHRRDRRRARLLQLDAQHGAAQRVPQTHGLRDRPYIQRHQSQALHDRTGHVAAGEGAQPRRLGRLLALPARDQIERLSLGTLQLPAREPQAPRSPGLQPPRCTTRTPCWSAGVSTAKNSTRPT